MNLVLKLKNNKIMKKLILTPIESMEFEIWNFININIHNSLYKCKECGITDRKLFRRRGKHFKYDELTCCACLKNLGLNKVEIDTKYTTAVPPKSKKLLSGGGNSSKKAKKFFENLPE